MPAPSLEHLYGYEEAIEAAWSAILDDAGGRVFRVFSTGDLIAPRYEVQLTSAAPTGTRREYAPGKFALAVWKGTLLTRIVTVRGKNSDQQTQLLGRARLEAQYYRDKFTPALLPWHELGMLEEAGLNRYVDEENDFDVSDLTHTIAFAIRKDAWPSNVQ